MKDRWERLFGLCLPARLWEEEVLPARLNGYTSRLLDTLFAEAGLLWFGASRQRIGFCFGPDAELYIDTPREDSTAAALFPGESGRYGFWDLVDSSHLDSAAVAERLWDLAWKGKVSADSFQPVRRAIANGFRPAVLTREQKGSRGRFAGWQASRPSAGFWFRVRAGDAETHDALDEEENARERIRQALQRYGVVFREILERELPSLRWSRLFRSLRLMEFSGEVVAGRFFDGVLGLQFALPSVTEALVQAPGEDAVYWMNAADPASLCGVGIEALKAALPSRLPSTHVVFHGTRVVLVSRRTAEALEFRVPPTETRIPDYLGFLRVLTSRDQNPLPSVHVLTVNGEPAGSSPYKPALLRAGFVDEYLRLTLRARG